MWSLIHCDLSKQRNLGPILWDRRSGLITEWTSHHLPCIWTSSVSVSVSLILSLYVGLWVCLLAGGCPLGDVFGCVKEVFLLCVWLYRVRTQSTHSLNKGPIYSGLKLFLLDINITMIHSIIPFPSPECLGSKIAQIETMTRKSFYCWYKLGQFFFLSKMILLNVSLKPRFLEVQNYPPPKKNLKNNLLRDWGYWQRWPPILLVCLQIWSDLYLFQISFIYLYPCKFFLKYFQHFWHCNVLNVFFMSILI